MGINRWRKVKLKTLCNRIGDGLHGTPKYSKNSDVYFINGNNLTNGKILISKDTKKVPDFEWNNNFIELNKNSLLLSINGTIGEMAFYNDEKVMLGKSIAYLNFKSGINIFYYYYFQIQNIQKYFYQIATGSTIKNLGLKSIQDFEVSYPNIESWKPITRILNELDKKIEINNKINIELEAFTKLIYDYWFVQFDFPDHDGKPYKSSGGQMVYNEDLKREVPYGWKVRDFGVDNNIQRGDLITSDTLKNGNVKVVSAGIKSSQFHDQANRSANVITISSSGANAGYINFWREQIFASDCITVQAGSIVETILALQFLKIAQKHIYRKASGSAQPHVYPSDLTSLKYLLPPKKLIDLFENKVIAANDFIRCKNQENEKLEKLRDWLLPILMNGQVTIKDEN